MANLKDVEKVGRQALLATLGGYAKGWEYLSDKVTLTIDDANKVVNELIENGEKVESELKAKIKSNNLLDEKIASLKAKLGVDTSAEERLAELEAKVDALTDALNEIVDARLAALTEQANSAEAKAEPTATTPAKAVAKKAPAKKAPAAKTAAAKKAPARTTTTKSKAKPAE